MAAHNAIICFWRVSRRSTDSLLVYRTHAGAHKVYHQISTCSSSRRMSFSVHNLLFRKRFSRCKRKSIKMSCRNLLIIRTDGVCLPTTDDETQRNTSFFFLSMKCILTLSLLSHVIKMWYTLAHTHGGDVQNEHQFFMVQLIWWRRRGNYIHHCFRLIDSEITSLRN